jgi:hypothetical protein
LLVAVGKNGRSRGQEPDVFDRQSCLFHDFPLGAGLEAFAMFKMPTRVGDKTWRRISILMSSQCLDHHQVHARTVTSFPLADQYVIVGIASEDENCNTDAGTRHDDSWPEQIW